MYRDERLNGTDVLSNAYHSNWQLNSEPARHLYARVSQKMRTNHVDVCARRVELCTEECRLSTTFICQFFSISATLLINSRRYYWLRHWFQWNSQWRKPPNAIRFYRCSNIVAHKNESAVITWITWKMQIRSRHFLVSGDRKKRVAHKYWHIGNCIEFLVRHHNSIWRNKRKIGVLHHQALALIISNAFGSRKAPTRTISRAMPGITINISQMFILITSDCHRVLCVRIKHFFPALLRWRGVSVCVYRVYYESNRISWNIHI